MTEPKKKSWHDLSDPVTVASVLVRDHLDTVIYRHGKVKGDAVSAAVLQLAMALLEHLPGEAKHLRASAPCQHTSLIQATGKPAQCATCGATIRSNQ